MKNNNSYHTSVLLYEAIEALNIVKDGRYIDATLGGGGHTEQILEKGGWVLGIDQDVDAIKECRRRFKEEERFLCVQDNFRNIGVIAENNNFVPANGVLFDLGTSLHQLKKSGKGFSFLVHERLDMRMSDKTDITALDVINRWPSERLVEIFEEFGEENESGIVVREIVRKRRENPITYSDELAQIISSVKSEKRGNIHPATKVFQALRIAVNDELSVLSDGISGSVGIVGRKGRVVVITFHSLEDRIVKKDFLNLEQNGLGKIVSKRPIVPTRTEVKKNKQARSAKIRVFEKN